MFLMMFSLVLYLDIVINAAGWKIIPQVSCFVHAAVANLSSACMCVPGYCMPVISDMAAGGEVLLDEQTFRWVTELTPSKLSGTLHTIALFMREVNMAKVESDLRVYADLQQGLYTPSTLQWGTNH